MESNYKPSPRNPLMKAISSNIWNAIMGRIFFFGDIVTRLLPASHFNSRDAITKHVESLLRKTILNKAPTGSALRHMNTETTNYNDNSEHTLDLLSYTLMIPSRHVNWNTFGGTYHNSYNHRHLRRQPHWGTSRRIRIAKNSLDCYQHHCTTVSPHIVIKCECS